MSHRLPHRASAIAFAVFVATAATAQSRDSSAPEPSVRLAFRDCPQVPEHEVRRLLEVELGKPLVASESDTPDLTEVLVSCTDREFEIGAQDSRSSKLVVRMVEVVGLDSSSQARLLALAIEELVTEIWNETDQGPNPAPSAASATSRPAPRPRPPPPPIDAEPWDSSPRPRPRRFMPIVAYHGPLTQPGSLWGAGARIAADEFGWIGWSADTAVAFGSVHSAHSSTKLSTASVSGSILLRQQWSAVAFRAGIGIRAGATRAHRQAEGDQAASPTIHFGPWGWPLAVFGLGVQISRTLVFETSTEAGYYFATPMEGAAIGVQSGFGVVL